MRLSRLARWCIIVSAAGAIAVQTWLASPLWTELPWLTGAAFLAAGVLARVRPAIARALVLLPACILPALYFRATGYYEPAHASLWLGALLGAIVGAGGARDWKLPGHWAPALGHYGLCLALSWIVIAAREADWQWALVQAPQPPVTAQGVPAGVAIAWIAQMVSAQLVAILWLDSLFGDDMREDDLARFVAWPLIASASVAAAVAIVQVTRDISWLNSGIFAFLGRASGPMLDANAYGMAAALAVALAVVAALQSRRLLVRALSAAFAVASTIGVWGSSSRTALLELAIVFMAAIASVILTAKSGRVRLGIAGLLIVACLGTLSAARLARSQAIGPLARLQGWLHDPDGKRSMAGTLRELWTRDGYGTAAVRMIRDEPLAGVGAGTFNFLVLDYTFRIAYPIRLPTDNAQNWYRHQLAEVGVLGSVGWITWLALLGTGLARGWRRMEGAALVAVSALIGLGLISLVGMPTQSPIVLILAATLAAWAWRLLYPRTAPIATARWPWLFAWTAALVFVALTTRLALSELRVPERAAATGWEYTYGLSKVEPSTIPFRWTGRRAVAVVPAKGKYLRLQVRVQHPDVAQNPVDVRVRLFDRTIIRERLRSDQPVLRYVEVPEGTYLSFTFLASRTFTGPPPDPRQLGMAVDDWLFVDTPPRGGHVIPWK